MQAVSQMLADAILRVKRGLCCSNLRRAHRTSSTVSPAASSFSSGTAGSLAVVAVLRLLDFFEAFILFSQFQLFLVEICLKDVFCLEEAELFTGISYTRK